jgi:hypothetical protein
MAWPSSSPTTSSQAVPDSLFDLIHELHATVTRSIDTSLSWEQLNSPPINYTLVRPIVDRFCLRDVDGKLSDVKTSVYLGVPPSGIRKPDKGKGITRHEPEVSLGGILYALMANR